MTVNCLRLECPAYGCVSTVITDTARHGTARHSKQRLATSWKYDAASLLPSVLVTTAPAPAQRHFSAHVKLMKTTVGGRWQNSRFEATTLFDHLSVQTQSGGSKNFTLILVKLSSFFFPPATKVKSSGGSFAATKLPYILKATGLLVNLRSQK